MPPPLLRRIQKLGPGLAPRLSRAANFIVQKPDLVVLGSLRSLAGHAGVAPSTLTRLYRSLGYDSFNALRAELLEGLQEGDPGFSSQAAAIGKHGANSGLHGSALARGARQAVERVERTSALNPPGALEEFASACLAPKHLFVLGLRSCHALAHAFAYLERFMRQDVALVSDGGSDTLDALGEATPEDALCIFSQSPYARLAVRLAEFAHQREVPLLVVTDRPDGPYGKWARHALFVDAGTPSFFPSQLGGQFLIEQIALAQVSAAAPAVLRNIERREGLLQAMSTYLPPASGTKPHGK